MEPEEKHTSENSTSVTIVKLVNVMVMLFVLVVFLFVAFLFQRWNKQGIYYGGNKAEESTWFCGTMDVGRYYTAGNLSGDGKLGKTLFKAHCATCHSFSRQLTGPALEGVFNRAPAPAEEYLFKYIKNEKQLRKQKDKYALKIYNEYNGATMPSYEFLNNQELKSIVAYLKP